MGTVLTKWPNTKVTSKQMCTCESLAQINPTMGLKQCTVNSQHHHKKFLGLQSGVASQFFDEGTTAVVKALHCIALHCSEGLAT